MPRYLRFLAIPFFLVTLCNGFVTGAAQAQERDVGKALWVGQASGLLKVSTIDGAVLLEIPGLGTINGIALDDHRLEVWAISGRKLYRFDFDGNQELATLVPPPGPSGSPPPTGDPPQAIALAADSSDGSAWIGLDDTLYHLNAAGGVLLEVQTSGPIRGLAMSLSSAGDRILWMATAGQLAALDPRTGETRRVIVTDTLATIQSISVDRDSGGLWLLDGGRLSRYTEDGGLLFQVPLTGLRHIAADGAGGCWADDGDLLYRIDPGGTVLFSRRPFPGGLRIVALVADPSDLSGWPASRSELAQFSTSGAPGLHISLWNGLGIDALGLYADIIPPQITINEPTDGSFLPDGRPSIELTMFDIGSGIDRGSLALRANDSSFGAKCTFGDSGTSAICTPDEPFSEGEIELTARIADLAGNLSEPARATFTIDMTPPVVTVVSPADGLLTNQPQQMVVGSVSEPVELHLNGATVPLDGQNAFDYGPVSLAEGGNVLAFIATDRAGNQGETDVAVTLDTIPPDPIPADAVTTIAGTGGQVQVTAAAGAAEPGAAFTITNPANGAQVTGTVQPDGGFSAAIAAAEGDTLEIVLTDGAGNSSPPTGVPVGQPLPPDPVEVAPPLDETIVTGFYTSVEFLWNGTPPIQTGVAPGTMDPRRVAVLRGRVLDRAGQPISGVAVTIIAHPELGQTLTRADGRYDMAVNGGGRLRISFAKAYFLPVERALDTPWNDFRTLPDVVLIPLDSQVTEVQMGAGQMQTAQGSPVTDADGTRQATVLVPAATTATMTLPDGTTQPLATAHLRATEYTVGDSGPNAMPAELPPTTAYTYCVDLSADEALAAGAKRVDFSQPLPVYVSNFLHFHTGIHVPAGYLDEDTGSWIPSSDGRVIEILSITGGMADLDIDGSGTPADAAALAALGITDAERTTLATLYTVGDSLWRVPITHFSAWDFNMGTKPPDGAAPPDQPKKKQDPLDDPCDQCGSIIEAQNQILGEREPATGTPFSLSYRSDRVAGRKTAYSLEIPLSGATVPAPLLSIKLELSIAGRHSALAFPAAPNQSYAFSWDGLDAYGRRVQGERTLSVAIGYVYDAVYLEPSERPGTSYDALFGHFSYYGVPATTDPAREHIILWQRYQVRLGPFLEKPRGLGGWSLSVHHVYDPADGVLYLGNGERRHAVAMGRILTTPPGASNMYHPQGLAIADDGTLYVPDYSGGNLWKITPDGARSSLGSFSQPHGAAVGPDGGVYVADPWSGAVFRVDPESGAQTTVANIGGPLSVAFGPDGLMYVGGLWPGRIYRIEANGQHTVIAGAGNANPGDGGRAADAKVGAPYDLTFDGQGFLFFIDADLKRVRKVTPDGIITTVAGNGQSGQGGDGGPATQAELGGVSGVAPDGDGLLIAQMSGVLRRVDAAGIIRRIAGAFAVPPGTPINGAPALQGSLAGPRIVRVGPDGAYYVDGWSGGWIRKVAPVSAAISDGQTLVASFDGREVYVFDSTGRHLRTLNVLTGSIVYQFAYDADGRLTTITDGDGNVTTIQRDGDGNATAIVAPEGQTTTLAYDANGYLASVTNPAGETTSFAYTAEGLMTSKTDPRGNASTFAYDSLGRLTKDTDAAGGFTALARTVTDSGFTVTTTTATGRTTTYAVTDLPTGDQQRTVTEGGCSCNASETVKGADGTTTTTARDGTVTVRRDGPDPRFGMQAPIPAEVTVTTPSGLASTTTTERQVTLNDPNDILSLKKQIDTTTVNGRVYRMTYLSASDRILWQTAPSGRSTTTYLDDQGRVISQYVPGMYTINYTYDARGRLVTVHQPSRAWTLSYDGDGNLASIMDPLSRTTAFAYDAAGRVTTQTLPDGRQIHFAYDTAGNVTAITPPGRPAHAFAYTAIDQQSSYTPPDVGIGPTATTYSYTLDRQLAHITRPDGHTVDFAYDNDGRLATITFDRGDIAFTYDPATGRLTGLAAPGGEGLSFTYDGFLQTGTTWTGTINGSVTRTYDSNFWVTSTSVDGANTAAFAYDDDGLLTQAGDLVITRDKYNGLITGTALNIITDTRTYNNYGEPASYTASDPSGSLYTVTYTRDALGRITQKAETIAGDQMTWDYAYDQAGRLVSSTLTTPGGTFPTTYTYDPNGNRLQKVGQFGTETGTYDAQDRMLSYGPCTYAYTANGELESKACGSEVTTYQYDTFGNLTHVVMPDGITIDYVIDARNRRVGKKVNGALVQGFLYGDQLNPVAELDGSGAVVARFVYGTKPNVPDYVVKGGVTYRYVTDQLGSVRLVVDAATGTIAQRIDYDEYGVVIQDTNPSFQPFGFAGGITDGHTGLIRFGARDYDPQAGRWTSKDPISFDGGIANLYGFVVENPVNFFDPGGLRFRNDTPCPVLIKPEVGKPFWFPGYSTYPGGIDGVRVPAWGDDWFKVPDGTDVILTYGGQPKETGGWGLVFPSFPDAGGPFDLAPGRKHSPDWEKRHSDWATPAGPPPPCKKRIPVADLPPEVRYGLWDVPPFLR